MHQYLLGPNEIKNNRENISGFEKKEVNAAEATLRIPLLMVYMEVQFLVALCYHLFAQLLRLV